MTKTLGWGILGTGNIARQIATGHNDYRRGKLVAVGSRSESSARAFAQTYAIPTAYGSYDQVLTDPSINAVYISLPNSLHHEWTLKALRAGKHVLCEKPIASNLAEAQEMFDIARQTGLVLVEAFMYRAHPQTHAVLETIRSGAIGQVELIRTSFCYRTTVIQGNIRFDPALAGGSLMDVGCYCINFSCLIAGQAPSSAHAVIHRHPTGIDDIAAGTLQFPNGILADFTCGMSVQADNTAYICGDEGYIEIPVPWKPPRQRAAYTIARGTPPRMDNPASKSPPPPPRHTYYIDANMDLYALEADAFAAVVLDAQPPFVTPDQTLTTMRILDNLRESCQLPVVSC